MRDWLDPVHTLIDIGFAHPVAVPGEEADNSGDGEQSNYWEDCIGAHRSAELQSRDDCED
jgi:hypothetical protein